MLSRPKFFVSEYDERNRLTNISRDEMPLARWQYNGRGERVAVHHHGAVLGSAVVLHMFDETGQRLSRLTPSSGDGESAVDKSTGEKIYFPTTHDEVIWLDSTPIAQVVSTDTAVSNLRYIHSDHLNTPRALVSGMAEGTQPANTVVWRWQLNQHTAAGSNAFGTQPANADPDGNGTAIDFDLRFPGQQFDVTSGLHYNYFRDYEPGTGRYVESDPIGLKGGVSTYGYVRNQPLVLVDKYGLVPGAGPLSQTKLTCYSKDCKQTFDDCYSACEAMLDFLPLRLELGLLGIAGASSAYVSAYQAAGVGLSGSLAARAGFALGVEAGGYIWLGWQIGLVLGCHAACGLYGNCAY